MGYSCGTSSTEARITQEALSITVLSFQERHSMLAEPLVLPHADGNISLVRINNDGFSSVYRYIDATQRVLVHVKHTTMKNGKDRHNVEVVQTVFATAEAVEVVRKTYIVFENDASDTDVKLLSALCGWLTASAAANTVKLFNWES